MGSHTPPIAAQGAQAGWARSAWKLALVGSGCLLLMTVSGGWAAVVALGIVGLVAYAAAAWIDRRPTSRLDLWVERMAVPGAFVALVLMNVFGLVGTLTGVRPDDVSRWSTAFVAMPFYLLSAASLVADIGARRMRLPAALDFATYMALPFKLLAGPLEPPRLMRQIEQLPLRPRAGRLRVGWAWIVLGAVMKYVIANRLEPARHLVATDPVSSFLTAAVFELKFYFDFAGYSFMGFGAALCFGLRINQNFNHPFLAPNVVMFWRCWHMSLGRFLSRYVLEPNLGLWRGKRAKLIFASSIFLVSAMWHGGTFNYLLWGLFHGSCYFAYVQWLKRRDTPRWLGVGAMLLFFVFGRMFAIDANGARLGTRLLSFFDPTAYAAPVSTAGGSFLLAGEINALWLALGFLIAEIVSQTRWKRSQGYHLLRRPWSALALTLLFVFFGQPSGALLYARL